MSVNPYDAPPGLDVSPLGVLGFSARQERLYRLLLRHSGSGLTELAGLVGLPVGELREQVRRFAGVGVVQFRDDDAVVARPPREALGRLITEEARRVHSRAQQLDAVRDLLPSLHADHLAATSPTGQPVAIELVEGGSLIDLVRSLVASSTGDVLWLRPDPWNVRASAELDECVRDLLAVGRVSRAVYPVEVLRSTPEEIRARADAGEQVRVLSGVPTRLAVFGSTAAMLGQPIGGTDGRRTVIRYPAMVAAMTGMFEALWDRALTVPAFVGRPVEEGGSLQRLLLRQLAGGAKDEQIARALGLSLRTVRRRIAALLGDLGAESRFQAGVEASRRGWL